MEQIISSSSESVVISLCKEIEYIRSRTKIIKQSLKHCQNKTLTSRLDIELSKLKEKINSIQRIAEKLFHNNSSDLSIELLLEITHRTIFIQNL